MGDTAEHCNHSDVFALSDFCTNSSKTEEEARICFPDDIRDWSMIAGIWCLANAFVGFSGNLLTILAIPYAAKRKKFNLHLHWTTTIFILNLAFADFLYCAINLPLYAVQYLKQRWIWGQTLCFLTTAFRYINAFADWMCVAMIAVSRCISLSKPDLGEKLFSGRSGKIIICLVWVYANVLILPIYTQDLGTFGYNCRIGKCDFVPLDGTDTYPRVVLYGVGFTVPCVLTTISYMVIWWYVWCNDKYLKSVGHSDMKKALTKREIRTTWTLFLVCFCYFLFVMPIALVNIIDFKSNSPQIHLALFCLYWLQYSLNFFIYAARSEQYRKAYSYFLWKVKAFVCGYKEETSTTTALFYVNKKMLPTILKNYAEAQLPGEMASAIFHSWPPHISSIANHSNLSLAGSVEELNDESAVIIVTRYEKGMRRRTSDVYRDKLFDWALRAHSTKRKANIFTTDDKNDFVLQVFNDRNNSQISSLHNVKLAAKLTAEKGNMNALNLHRNRRRVSL